MQGVKHVIIGTAGHVDHGKTTLTQALTGVNTDRLSEEQARGMTIDLGFAPLLLDGDPPVSASLVDVPGHERFVKNMLAGTGGVDVALVVVAADEGVMPQTREHRDVLTVLDVRLGVIALTKCDLADPELREIAEETIREAFQGTPLADAPIVSVGAQTGEGLTALRQALYRTALQVPPRSVDAPFRLPVDRVFSLPGVGTVATGTLAVGTLRTGDAILVLPQNKETRARTLQSHNIKIEQATAGMRTAVNVPGVDVGDIERGAVLCAPGTLAATTLFDAHLQVLPDASRSLKHRERVRIHLGTGEVLARLQLIDRDEVRPGDQTVPAQILCETPTVGARGERFVVRAYSPACVVGGGIVLDPAPQTRRRKYDPAAVALFAAREGNQMTDTIYAILAARHEAHTPAQLATQAGVSEAEVSAALDALAVENRAFGFENGTYLADVSVSRLRETARRTLATFHRQNPFKPALNRDALRTPLAKAAAIDFGAALTFLNSAGDLVIDEKGGVHAPGRAVVLPPTWEVARRDMLAVFQAGGLNPPQPDNFQANLPRDVNVRVILSVLCDEGALVPLGEEIYLSAQAFASARAVVEEMTRRPEGATVAQVRDATGSSRKVILPLMEYFDARHLTRRQGDARVWVG